MAVRGFAGTGGTQGSIGTVGTTSFQSIDPASLPGGGSFSRVLEQLLGQVNNLRPPSYSDLISEGLSSPLLQSVLGPALQNLIPGEEQARQTFNDEFRSAGALGSGAQAVGSAKLEGALQGQRGNLISQVISQILPQLISGLHQQYSDQAQIPQLLASVLGQTRPSVVSGSAIGPSISGGGGSGGGSPRSSENTQSAAERWDQMNAAGFRNLGPRPGRPPENELLRGLDLTGLGGKGDQGGSWYSPPSTPDYNYGGDNSGAGGVTLNPSTGYYETDYGPEGGGIQGDVFDYAGEY